MPNELDLQKRQQKGELSASILDEAKKHLSDEQWQLIAATAIKEKMELDKKNNEMILQETYAQASINQHVDAVNQLPSKGLLDGHKVQSDIKTATGNIRIESKSGRACFVATAAYGDPNHPDVEYLRQFRDEYLRKSFGGRLFISTYYKIGPYLAAVVMHSTLLRKISLYTLSNLVHTFKIKYPVNRNRDNSFYPSFQN